ncbi:serine/threonine protein kinase [Streptomyces sp. RS10V-4]|uniref:serine/threonine protein kinase n=1 Tax=Streptomyces rhizoryzae TaxID=2932493 RepID=UPI002004468D|nr:serine/threonine protein kinase [Streptomyces rhizoryzae]MCK7623078.1 serine/threonine protein kinase [Streptomyces rhizoryzae]
MGARDMAADGPEQFDPLGPYLVLARLDDPASPVPVPERRYVARTPDGDRTVLLGTALPGTDPGRFLAEAETSRYLLGPWASPATDVSGPGARPWHARPYVPVLPLPAALAAHGGPLPERTVRALGAALAETLLIGHGQGLSHAGLAPAAVLLAADGPRLTCFGAVRAAAPDGTPRSGLPGLESGSLPPEQAAGGTPQPAGDVYALGATLAYAATGHTVPEQDELPAGLRSLVGACLARDPGARPQPADVLDALAPAAAAPPPGAAAPTAPDAASGARAAAGLGPGWLPGRVIAELARRSAALLALDVPAARRPAAGPAPAAPAVPPTPVPAGATLPTAAPRRQD